MCFTVEWEILALWNNYNYSIRKAKASEAVLQTDPDFSCQTGQVRFRIYLPGLKYGCPQKCMCVAMSKYYVKNWTSKYWVLVIYIDIKWKWTSRLVSICSTAEEDTDEQKWTWRILKEEKRLLGSWKTYIIKDMTVKERNQDWVFREAKKEVSIASMDGAVWILHGNNYITKEVTRSVTRRTEL